MRNRRTCGVFVFLLTIWLGVSACDNSGASSRQQSPANQGDGASPGRPTNPAISLDHAIEIAQDDLRRRNISATFHRHSGMDWERGQWVWELEFRPNNQRGVIEYYINVHTGAIVKFEWDR